MLLSDYQWSHNPRGLHVQRILITPLELQRWTRPQMGWVKLIASELEYVDDSQSFLAANVTPILRPYRARWGAAPLDHAMREQINEYARVGVKWFEFYNEPNLDDEWPFGTVPHWQNLQGTIAPLMDNWLVFAEYIISIGGYPGFPALAESADPRQGAVPWLDAFLTYLAQNRYDRFKNVLASGMYIATHPYVLNHFYQEKPGGGPRSARPPEQQRGNEGGWHFEYPYDPITQDNDTGRTVYGGTSLTPNGDPNGLLAVGRMVNERCAEVFGTQAIPVVGTEGGIWPFRHQPYFQQDNRFPPYNEESQAEATLAMFNWISQVAPPWFFGVCLWKEDDYYFNGNNAPAINRLAESPTIFKDVPGINVMEGGFSPGLPESEEEEVLAGPGPIQGQADYHMLVLAPGLETRMFFDTADDYWDTFRPIVTTHVELIDLFSQETSLAVTVIAPPDMVEMMTQAIHEQYPNVWFDLIVAEDVNAVGALLEARVNANRRFG